MSKDQSGNLQKAAEGRYPYMEQDAATGKGAMLFNERQEIKREAYIAGMQDKEKEAIEFVEWLVTTKVDRIGGGMWEVDGLGVTAPDGKTGISPCMSTEQLYNLYRESK